MKRGVGIALAVAGAAVAVGLAAWWAAGAKAEAAREQAAGLGVAGARVAQAALEAAAPKQASRQELEKLAGEHWYRVEVLGQPSGWMYSHTWVEDGPDGKPRVVSVNRLEFKLVLNGVPLEASSEVTTVTDSALRPVKVTMVSNEMGREKVVRAEVAGEALHVKVEAGGKSFERDIPLPQDWGSELDFALRASSGRLKPGEKFTVSIFDPQLVDFERHHITVGDWQQMEIGGQERRVIVLHDETEKLKLKSRTYVDAEGVMWRQEVPGMLEMVMEKVSEDEAKKVGRPLSLTNRVEVDKKLPRPEKLSRLVLIASVAGSDAPPFASTDRQRLTKIGDSRWRVEMTGQVAPQKIQPMPPRVPDELREFLAGTSLAQKDDERIKAKAADIVRGSKDAWQAARAIVQWVYKNMRKVESEPRPVSAAEIFDAMRGDCTEHATLAGALARAAGLPSKLCVGLAYTGGAFYYHAWVKIWVGEWVEMDPTWGEDTVDPSHLLVGDGNFDELSLAKVSLATARTIGRLKMKVVQFETK